VARRLALLALGALSLLAVLAGCGGDGEEPASETAPASPPTLQGVAWQWQGSLYNDDTEAVPDDPARYTAEFADDGTVSILADCNQVSGTYEEGGDGALTITLGPSTTAACPEDSLADEFLRDLEGAAIAFFDEAGVLRIDIKFDSGTMQFEPAP
jgi:heat shock protein HslJ